MLTFWGFSGLFSEESSSVSNVAADTQESSPVSNIATDT